MAAPVRAEDRALRAAALALALGLGLGSGCAPPDHPLTTGSVDRPSLAPGAVRRYEVRLTAGDLLRVSVDQRGLDATLRVEDRPEVDLPYGDRVREELWWVADRDGRLRFELSSLGGAGECTVRVEALRPASDAERRQVEAFWQVEAARAKLGSDPAAAVPILENAAAVWAAHGIDRQEALARGYLGQAYLAMGEPQRALVAFGEAVARAAEAPRAAETPLRGRLLEWRGRANEKAARFGRAAADYRTATALARQGGDGYGEALALNDLAVIDDTLGRLETAIDGYARAGALFAEVGAPGAELRARLNLAFAYMKLGAMVRARPLLEETLEATRGRAGFERLHADALRDLGWWHRLDGDLHAARRLLSAARGIAGDDLAILDRLATVHVDLGEHDRARSLYDAVGERVAGNRLWRAHLDSNRCRLEGLAGDPGRGLVLCRRALEAFEALEVTEGAAHVRYLIGTLHRMRGELEAAHAETERAVRMLEDGRLRSGTPELRSLFTSVHLEPYRSLVQIEMALHRRAPEDGWDLRAMRLSELTRARQLKDFLAAERGDAAAAEAAAAEAAAAEAAAAETAGAPPELPRIQELLDPDTSLLVYQLDAGTSFLWLADEDGLHSFELPGAEVVVPAAEAWYAHLAEPFRRGGWGAAAQRRRADRLSRLLLEPVAGRVAGRRLVIVADGVLRRLPFAALPAPGGDGRPMLAEHEIVLLPSAAVLSLLRRESAARPAARGLIAVLADPVFGPGDERVGADNGELRFATSYSRLAASGAEARELLALAPAASSLLLEGFEARLDRVLDGRLAGFRIVHFATHTQTTASRDRPYGLLLSRLDPDGRPIAGLLDLRELYELRLPAELVTLSACGTALGDDFDGEGLLGLTHGFMRAGSPRVIVSLWAVEDLATRELMGRFYRGLLIDRLGPAAALRRAQLSMWRQDRPLHEWAGFVLHGDWRPFEID